MQPTVTRFDTHRGADQIERFDIIGKRLSSREAMVGSTMLLGDRRLLDRLQAEFAGCTGA